MGTNDTQNFLDALFEGVPGRIEVRPLNSDGVPSTVHRCFARDARWAGEAASSAEAAGLNVFVGTATRTDEAANEGTGKKEDLAWSRSCWADIDGTSAEADEKLAKFEAEHGLRASMVVRSSEAGGVHAYFFFDAPLDLSDSENPAWLENANRGICDALGGDRNACDATRVLRVPGTTNRPNAKKRSQGRVDSPCTLIREWDGTSYPLARFDGFAKRGEELASSTITASYTGRATPLHGVVSDRVAELLRRHPKLQQRFDGVPSDTQRDLSPSGFDASLAGMLAYHGVPVEEIAEALAASREKRGHMLTYRHDKMWRTAEKAAAHAQARQTETEEDGQPPERYTGLYHQATGKYLPDTVSGDLAAMLKLAPPSSILPVNATDVKIAEAFARSEWSKPLRYCPGEKEFRAWDGRRWGSEYVLTAVKKCIFGLVSGIEAIASFDDNEERQEFWGGQCRGLHYSRRLGQVLPRIKEELETEMREFDVHPLLLNLRNGVIGPDGILRPHDPSLMFTKIAGAEWIPGATCEAWDRFLETSFPDEDERRFLQRVIGVSLFGEPEKVIILIIGDANSGKTTLLKAVEDALGDYGHSTKYKLFTEDRYSNAEGATPGLARLAKKRFVYTSEVDKKRPLNEALLKLLTGRDTVQARGLFKDDFPFVPEFTLFIAGNDVPPVDWASSALWERIKIVKSTCPGKKDFDPELKAKLSTPEARAAILQWAFQGYRDYREHDRDLQVPDSVHAAVAHARDKVDRLKGFFDARCALEPGKEVWSQELCAEFNAFISPEQVSPEVFGKMLRERGFETTKRRGGSGRRQMWQGIRLLTSDELRGPEQPEAL